MSNIPGPKANPTSFLVAASTASGIDKQIADFVCTGTNDDVPLQAAITLAQTLGGVVRLTQGVFNCAAGLTVAGPGANADTVDVSIIGVGNETTILNFANNLNGITISGGPKLVFRDFQVKVLGSGTGLKSTGQTVSPYWSFWNSEFTNIMIRSDFSTHTGYAIDFESPFRSTFTNIEAKGIKNGVRIKSHNVNFNPGNCTFNRCFMDCAITGGVAWDIVSVLGYMNICTFIQCESIDSSATPSGSIGWRLMGTSSWSVRNIFIINSNPENAVTAVSLIYASDNDIWLDYANTGSTTGTIFLLDANSGGNNLRFRQNYVGSGATTVAINDSYTGNNSNILSGYDGFVAGTMSVVNSTTTIFREGYMPGSGTVASQLQRFNLPTNTIAKGYTVATLPTGKTGAVAYVTDALTPSFGTTLVGGGTITTLAFFNGTNWIAS